MDDQMTPIKLFEYGLSLAGSALVIGIVVIALIAFCCVLFSPRASTVVDKRERK